MQELLANRPPALTVRLEERRIGRSHFDRPNPEAQFVRAAEDVGYSAAVIARGGTPPNYAWMGPGDRWIELAVTANEPTGASAASVRPQRFVTPAPASPAELLSRYRAWVGNGDFAECFGDWVRRSRSGTRPGPLDQATQFWLNALAAYSGLRDGRADPSDIATAAGLAEQVIDPSDFEQVDFARRIRSMYMG